MTLEIYATVSLKGPNRKRRHKCTLKSYDRFINKWYLRLTIKVEGQVQSGGMHS